MSEITHVRTFGRGSKYGAKRTTLDGFTFASKAEARRYAELVLLQKAGVIQALRVQPRYPLHACGKVIGEYVGDFDYVVTATDVLITEDVKGILTAMYRWKKKHFQAEYGRVIHEITR